MTAIARSSSRSSSLGKALTALLATLVGATLLGACGGAGGGRANVSPGAMPSGATFTGVYSSPQYGEIHMIQTGAQVVAEYSHDERRGRIQGTAQGNLLRFEWTDTRELVVGRPNVTRGRGYFQYTRGEDNSDYLVGEWGHENNETGGGPWRAVRLRNRQPSISGIGARSSGSSASGGDEPMGDDLDGPGSSSGGSGGGSGRSLGGDDLDGF